MAPVVRLPQSVRCMLVAVVCLAVGALVSQWIRSHPPQPDSVLEKERPARRRNRVLPRSRNPTLEQLEALGYVDATYPMSELAGVTLNEEARTVSGYNFYTSQAGARLLDMKGQELHRWQTDEEGRWQHAELLPNGDVIANVYNGHLSRYDKDSKRLWSVRGRFHHDFWIHGSEIYAVDRVGRVIEQVHPRSQTLVDLIQVLSLDGAVKREISVVEAILNSPYRFLLPSVRNRRATRLPWQIDILHVNHIEVFDGRLADRDPIYAEGNILLSARNINAIFILDGRTSEIVWIWGPTNLTFQHHPTLLENGRILVFDNGLTRSRVIEVEPLSGDIVWSYAPRSGFFSRFRGSNQRLANGNTLITESDTGYVREVTRNREVVWEFANPAVNSKQKRRGIWRMTRVDPQALGFLQR